MPEICEEDWEGKEAIGGGGFPSLFLRVIFVLFFFPLFSSVWVSLLFEAEAAVGPREHDGRWRGGCVRVRAVMESFRLRLTGGPAVFGPFR